MSAPTRVYVARLAGLSVFNPFGDQVGKARDVVADLSPVGAPRVIGIVIEVPGRRRVFVPMTRVTSLDAKQIITTGVINLRGFEQRKTETLLLGEVLERVVTLSDGSGAAIIEDLAIEKQRMNDWHVTRLFVRRQRTKPGLSSRFRRRGETLVLDVDEVEGLSTVDPNSVQSASLLAASFEQLKAADAAERLHGLPIKRRIEVAAEFSDDKLADIIEELPEDDQVEILAGIGRDRAADVLDEMQPDDAADLLAELPFTERQELLDLMEPDEADDVRRLLTYDTYTAGGLMTTVPVILPPEASVAEGLAQVRRAELTPSLASAVFVCRPPLETPTGKFLGVVHLQRLLREPPHVAVGTIIDQHSETLSPTVKLANVSRQLANYNLVSVPVTDAHGRLLGAVTADDVLDHMLPDDWREQQDLEGRLDG